MRVALVFLCSVMGNQPDPQGKRRLEKAIKLYRTAEVDVIMITGGKRQDRMLGLIYCQHLRDQRIPPEAIWAEVDSNTTASNLRYSWEFLKIKERSGPKITKTFFVSDRLHLLRIAYLARWNFWPWPYTSCSSGFSGWRIACWEPIKLAVTLLDPDEKYLDWFKRRRERTNF